MPAQVQKPAPDFTADAVVNGQFGQVRLSDYWGKKYVVLFFYPLDFTTVCPTEIIAFSDHIAEFEKRCTQVIGVSTDSKYSHMAWINTPRNSGGVGNLPYPLVSDLTKKISSDYGVLLDGAVALRGTFIIDRAGMVRHITINDVLLGRSVEETIRMLDALQFLEEKGEACGAGWSPGSASIKPNANGATEYFSKVR
jgi:alkyl hydroperoxide reductase subunit AhpC